MDHCGNRLNMTSNSDVFHVRHRVIDSKRAEKKLHSVYRM